MKVIYLYATLLILSSCAVTRHTLRTDQAAQDTFREESFLRYSPQRLEQFKNTPYTALAKCHQGDTGIGLRMLRKQAFVQKDQPFYWNQVGMCYFIAKDYQKATFYFDLSLKKSGIHPYVPAINNLGVLYLHLNHHQQALDHFKRAHQHNRLLMVPLFNLSQIYLTFHSLTPAKKILEKLYRRNNQDTEVIYSLGSLYLLEGNLTRADQLWKSIPDDRRKREDIALMRSLTLYQQKKYEQALSVLEEQDFGQFLSVKSSALKLRELLEVHLEERKDRS